MVMDNGEATKAYARLPLSVPFYYGWFIVALSFLANLTAAGIRSAPSVLIHPFEAEFGWSRTAIASAASLNLLLLGLFAPLGGWLIDRIGARRVILGCLSTIVAGLIGTVFVQGLWQLIILWGVVLGVATGVTPPLGASIASRWFVDRRGLAIGIMTNANAAGQVVYLPALWRSLSGAAGAARFGPWRRPRLSCYRRSGFGCATSPPTWGSSLIRPRSRSVQRSDGSMRAATFAQCPSRVSRKFSRPRPSGC
jgi:MFS family permease